jgi:hypothetical protein
MSAPQPSAERAAELVLAVKQLLPLEVQGHYPKSFTKLPMKVLSLREALLFRIADLSEAALSLEPGHGMGAAILARSVMETTAVLFALQEMVLRVATTGQLGDFDKTTVMRMLFGSRNKKTPVEAINVLTQIDRMDKTFKGLRSWYDDLSEFAHPNSPGVLISYGRLDRKTFALSLEKAHSDKLEKVSVLALCACLEIARGIRQKIENALEDFQKVCVLEGGRG